jgi:hypothetical protein
VLHESTGYAEASGPIEFDDWVARIETPAQDVVELRKRFLAADADLKAALQIQVTDGRVFFSLPKVTLVAERPA